MRNINPRRRDVFLRITYPSCTFHPYPRKRIVHDVFKTAYRFVNKKNSVSVDHARSKARCFSIAKMNRRHHSSPFSVSYVSVTIHAQWTVPGNVVVNDLFDVQLLMTVFGTTPPPYPPCIRRLSRRFGDAVAVRLAGKTPADVSRVR